MPKIKTKSFQKIPFYNLTRLRVSLRNHTIETIGRFRKRRVIASDVMLFAERHLIQEHNTNRVFAIISCAHVAGRLRVLGREINALTNSAAAVRHNSEACFENGHNDGHISTMPKKLSIVNIFVLVKSLFLKAKQKIDFLNKQDIQCISFEKSVSFSAHLVLSLNFPHINDLTCSIAARVFSISINSL